MPSIGHFGASVMMAFLSGASLILAEHKLLFGVIAIICGGVSIWQFRLGRKEFPDG